MPHDSIIMGWDIRKESVGGNNFIETGDIRCRKA
jgi:hypothetical protein